MMSNSWIAELVMADSEVVPGTAAAVLLSSRRALFRLLGVSGFR